MRHLIGILIGVVMIIGGLSGNLVLIGTNSGVALAVVGAALVVFDLARLIANRNQ